VEFELLKRGANLCSLALVLAKLIRGKIFEMFEVVRPDLKCTASSVPPEEVMSGVPFGLLVLRLLRELDSTNLMVRRMLLLRAKLTAN
jgi:NAD-dependent oxidoreductase involved in siderophore biosynthesis